MLILSRCCHVTARPQRTTNWIPRTSKGSTSLPLANSSNSRFLQAKRVSPLIPADLMLSTRSAAGSLNQALCFEAGEEVFHLGLHLSGPVLKGGRQLSQDGLL